MKRTPLQTRIELAIIRDLEVAKMGVMCAQERGARQRWMDRVAELKSRLADARTKQEGS